MSIHRSYFNRNNTIIHNSFTNTGRNPITELFFGNSTGLDKPAGYSRLIFDLDLTQLKEKIANGTITTTCQNNMRHILNMTNAIKFDKELLNTYNSNNKLRAISFDLILFRIPEQLDCYGPTTTTTTSIPVTTTSTTTSPFDCFILAQNQDFIISQNFDNLIIQNCSPGPSPTPTPICPTPTPTPLNCLAYEIQNTTFSSITINYIDCYQNQQFYTLSGLEKYTFCAIQNTVNSPIEFTVLAECIPPTPTPTPTVSPTLTPSPTTTTTTCQVIGCQIWDEGVGYDYYDTQLTSNSPNGVFSAYYPQMDRAFSTRPSNWFQATTLDFWAEPGIYNNLNLGVVNYSGLTIVDIQHFEFGNEDISFDMTNEINRILTGGTQCSGWGIAFRPEFELITGLTSSYSVSFFTRHTQTFYEPYLQTTYDDLIQDDRNIFVEHSANKLYLYVNIGGNLVSLDFLPTVTIQNNNGDIILSGVSSCERTTGVYEIDLPPFSGFTVPCNFTDTWTDLYYNGIKLKDVVNEFIIQPYEVKFQIGSQSKDPEIYGFDFYGIKQDEKILNTELRKVGVVIKKAYTAQHMLNSISAFYRVYVKEGQTEVQVQDWTPVNRTPNEYYFMFDTRDKLPNEYYVDIKVNTSGEVDIYKKQIKFQIVNKK